MYGPVPTSVPSRVCIAAECVSSSCRTTSSAFARPKSSTLACPRGVTMMFCGLDVAMDDASLVRLVEGIGDLHADRGDLRRVEPPAPQHGRERLALHVLHHQEVDVVLVADVEERADVGMAQRRDRPRLPSEPRAAAGSLDRCAGRTFMATTRSRPVSRAR